MWLVRPGLWTPHPSYLEIHLYNFKRATQISTASQDIEVSTGLTLSHPRLFKIWTKIFKTTVFRHWTTSSTRLTLERRAIYMRWAISGAKEAEIIRVWAAKMVGICKTEYYRERSCVGWNGGERSAWIFHLGLWLRPQLIYIQDKTLEGLTESTCCCRAESWKETGHKALGNNASLGQPQLRIFTDHPGHSDEMLQGLL